MLIQSGNINLRKTELSDLSFVIAVENNQDNTPYISQWSYDEHFNAMSNDNIHHCIIENSSGDKVGYVIITGLLDLNRAIYIKRIAMKEKNKGYGKEVLRLIIKFFFEQTNTHRIWLDVIDTNARAIHVYKTAGFKLEGTLRDCIIKDQKFISLSVMSILKHEYHSSLMPPLNNLKTKSSLTPNVRKSASKTTY